MSRGSARTAEEARAVIEAADYEPQEAYPGPGKNWRVRCVRCGRSRTVEARTVAAGRRPCRGCVAKTANADLAALDLQPAEEYPGATSHWAVTCQVCGWEGEVVVDKLRQGRRGCRGRCAPARGAHRLLAPAAAVASMQGMGFEPVTPYPGSAYPWPAIHLACGRKVAPTLNNLQSRTRSSGCTHCAGNGRLTEEAIDAFLASLSLHRTGPYASAREALAIRCERCGLEDRRRYDDIQASGVGCSYCAGKKMHVSHAMSLAARAKLQPVEPFTGSTIPWICRCMRCCGVVRVRAHDLRRQGGCSTCANSGFDDAASALVYLLYHRAFDAYKFGITNTDTPTRRISGFARRGWDPVRTWPLDPGSLARDAENHIKYELRVTRDLPPYLGAEQMPAGGWTETVGGDSMSLWQIVEIVAGAVDIARRVKVPCLPDVGSRAVSSIEE